MKVDPDSELSEAQVALLQQKLLEAHRELRERLPRRAQTPPGGPPDEDEPRGDSGDLGQRSFTQGLQVQLNQGYWQRLRDIEDALAKIDNGGYGVCEGTGDPIGFDRLAVEPWTRYTLAYQELVEAASGTGAPPRL